MPPFGRIKRFSLVGLAAATLGVTASSASASDVRLWACHGPAGQPLPGLLDSTRAESAGVEENCAEQGGGFAGGLLLPGRAFLQLGVPSGTTLTGVRISRRTSLAVGQRYALRTSAGELESQAFGEALAPDPADYPASGAFAKVNVSGPPSAAGGAAVAALALRVTDDEPPRGGSYGGWRSPASDTLNITVPARDVGVGLMSATAYLDDTPVATARYGDGSCNDLSPGPGTPVDLDYALVGRPDDVSTTPASAVGCPGFGTATLSVDTRGVADGNHTITITATDLAGNTATLVDKLATETLNNADRGRSSQTLSIGTNGPTAAPSPSPGGGSAGSGGVAGATATSCRSPKLSMFLAQKPLRVSGHGPCSGAARATASAAGSPA